MELRNKSLDRWLERVLAGWGARLASTAHAVGPSLVTWQPTPDLRAFGRAFAHDHHTLEQTLDCLRLLGEGANRAVRANLRHRSTVIAVTTGWADGTLDQVRLTRLVAPIDMLRLRLRQHFQLAHELGTDPADHAALLVIDPGSTPSVRQLDTIANHLHAVLDAGQTVAAGSNGTVLALVDRTTSLARDTTILATVLRAEPNLAGLDVRVWIEPLGHSVDFVDAHLSSLTG